MKFDGKTFPREIEVVIEAEHQPYLSVLQRGLEDLQESGTKVGFYKLVSVGTSRIEKSVVRPKSQKE